MKWALIIDRTVAEITDIDPRGRFHASLDWRECPDEVMQGWSYEEGTFIPPSDRSPEEKAKERREEILPRLDEIDEETIRPLRAITAGTGTDDDIRKIQALEKEAEELRGELQDLMKGRVE